MTDIARKRRPPQTTYSRKPANTDTAPPKRRRLTDENNDPTPSSSSSRSSSSPAPVTEDLAAPNTPVPSPPRPARKKSSFNFFTRTSSSSSSSSSSRRRVPPSSRAPPPKTKLTQMTIDLGQTLQTTCRGCGMSYHPSTPDDEALHKRFHAKSVGGVDFALKPSPPHDSKRVVWRAPEGDAYVLGVNRTATAAEKRKAKEVLEVVDSELGAAEITLWRDSDEDVVVGGGGGAERFKVYLYIQGRKCVGACLAERIERAYYVREDVNGAGGAGSSSSSLEVESVARPALMGVARIWTCSSHRRKGIAARLLDCARETFIYGMHLEKDMVAFSQPTESGGGLARGWFRVDGKGKEVKQRWAVYVEEA